MLLEYYSRKSEDSFPYSHQNTELFEGILTYISSKFRELFSHQRSLLNDICKLAGRLSKKYWKQSDIYGNSVNIMFNNMYNESDFVSTATLMVYYNELMLEMQSKDSKNAINEIYYITDIFIAAFQFFKLVEHNFLLAHKAKKGELYDLMDDKIQKDASIASDSDDLDKPFQTLGRQSTETESLEEEEKSLPFLKQVHSELNINIACDNFSRVETKISSMPDD